MLSEFMAWLIASIQSYGAWSVFAGVLIEEIIIPIPSPLIQMAAGFILIDSNLTFFEAIIPMIFIVVLPAAIAATIGSFFAYGIGYFGGKHTIKKFHRYFDVEWKEIEKIGKKFGKGRKTWYTIIILRLIPIVPMSLVSLAAGVFQLSWKKYTIATFIGAIPRAFILGFLGWFVGNAFFSIALQIDKIENMISVLIIIFTIGLIYYHHKNKKNKIQKKS
ncbi:MAG: VTT domain-containing protein [Candidatus Aenigmatarchaeota archaeon]